MTCIYAGRIGQELGEYAFDIILQRVAGHFTTFKHQYPIIRWGANRMYAAAVAVSTIDVLSRQRTIQYQRELGGYMNMLHKS